MTWASKTQGTRANLGFFNAGPALPASLPLKRTRPLSQLLQHAQELARNDFAVKFRSVWPDSLAHTAFDVCVRFIETDRRENREEFQRRWRSLQMRQLLLQRREKVSALLQQATVRAAIHALRSRFGTCTVKVLTKANITLCESDGDDVWVAVKHVHLPDKFSADQCRTVLQVCSSDLIAGVCRRVRARALAGDAPSAIQELHLLYRDQPDGADASLVHCSSVSMTCC